MTELIDDGKLSKGDAKRVLIHSVCADDVMCGLGPQANSTPMSVSSDNSAHWGGTERRYGLMTTSMTWVRDPRSTFKLPTFDKPDPTELAANLPSHA